MAARARIVVLACSLCFGACAVGPDYHRPSLDVPAAYRVAAGEAEARIDATWWQQFRDPALDGLIQEALANNPDVRIAAARVEEYAGRLESARGALFPQIGYGLSAGRDRATTIGPTPVPRGISPVASAVTAAASATWDIDLWGRLRRTTEAARADLLATNEARRGTVLSLVSQLAQGYVTLLLLDRQLEIAQRTLGARAHSRDLLQARFEGGVVSEVDLDQARSDYEATAATIPDLENAVHQQENALCVLLGRNPQRIQRGRTLSELGTPAVPAGLPAELLARRPDVLGAEASLVAANARLGAARALYFPTLSLTGSLGSSSTQFSSLFTGPARIWSYAGSVTGPIFAGGEIHGTVRQADAQRQQALLNYQKVIQNSFREVDDALIARQQIEARSSAQGRQVQALQNYYDTSEALYEGGYSSYLDVLDAQRNLFSAELSYAQTQADERTAMINLYTAMGGGWPQSIGDGVIRAAFVCAGGAVLNAVFDNHRQPNLVLALPDGRELHLPQVLSGSGARYANADESFVFWNKGNTAFVEERGKPTYSGCVTRS